MKKEYLDPLNPLANVSPIWRYTIAFFPTVIVILGRPLLPEVAQQTPAVFHYPAVLFATWVAGFLPGFISLLVCSLYCLFYIRPHLLTDPSSDVTGLLRMGMFLITGLIFIVLIALLQRSLKKARSAVFLRDDFMTLASHELNTPLTALKLQMDVARRILPDEGSEKVKSLIEASTRQIARLERLISSMMDLTLFDADQLMLKPSYVELNKIICEVANSLKAFSATPEQIELELSQQELWGNLDQVRVEQIIYNVLHNAIKYGKGRPILITSGKDDSHLWFSVTDHGFGISVVEQQQIFKRFHRGSVTSEIKGMGLGLYLARKLVDLHKGKVMIESDLGKGSKFTIRLPINKTGAA